MKWIAFFYILSIIYTIPETLAQTELPTGKVLVETEHPEAGNWPLKVRATVFVEAPPEEVWKVLTDFDHWAEFMPHIKGSRIVSRLTNEEVVVKQVFRIFFLSVKLRYAVKKIPYSRVEFSGRGSKMGICRGYWLLEPEAGRGTLLTCEAVAHPNFHVPAWIIKSVLRGWVTKGLSAIRTKVLEDMGIKILEEENNWDSLPQEGHY